MKTNNDMGPTLICICALALASCSAPEPPATNATGADDGVPAPAAVAVQPAPVATPTGAATPHAVESPTMGGDGSQIVFDGLTPAQLEGVELPGELACSFADADGATLLLARADVLPDGPVRGVVNHNGYAELLGNGRAGGFNDLADGITLSGKGLTVVLDRGESMPTGNEATQHDATLEVQRADGATRTYAGTLTCGP